MGVAREWRLKKQRYQLAGSICLNCSSRLFPPRDICPECGASARAMPAVADRHEVFSYILICPAPVSLATDLR